MGGDRVWRILIRLNNRRLQEEELEGGRGNNACRVTSLTIQMSAQATPEPGTTVYLPPSPPIACMPRVCGQHQPYSISASPSWENRS